MTEDPRTTGDAPEAEDDAPDAIVLLRPVRPEALLPFLDLDEGDGDEGGTGGEAGREAGHGIRSFWLCAANLTSGRGPPVIAPGAVPERPRLGECSNFTI